MTKNNQSLIYSEKKKLKNKNIREKSKEYIFKLWIWNKMEKSNIHQSLAFSIFGCLGPRADLLFKTDKPSQYSWNATVATWIKNGKHQITITLSWFDFNQLKKELVNISNGIAVGKSVALRWSGTFAISCATSKSYSSRFLIRPLLR